MGERRMMESQMDSSVLIVDDESSVRRLLTQILEANGYRCTQAADGAEARAHLKGHSFDLLLCDIRMPGESGLELIHDVKREHADTAIIMVTAVNDPLEAQTALEMGVYGYIIKPFEPNQILISVANGLRRRELEMKERAYRRDLEKAVRERTRDLVKTNKTLKKREAELEMRTRELEEVNTALRVLLRKREEDQAAFGESMLANVKGVVGPYLERLKDSRLSDEQVRYLQIIESNIRDIVSPFIKEISSAYLGLSPTEIQVANLIKQGKTTKEIAAVLNLSTNTVMSHRFKIRSKFGLIKNKTGLHTFLQSLR
jgi:DNA-binding NarL/FixJ family response regulator